VHQATSLSSSSPSKAQTDGYTQLVGNVSTNSINPIAFAHVLKFDPAKDLVGVTLLALIPNLLVSGAGFPPNIRGNNIKLD
jgi:hypothetical protein